MMTLQSFDLFQFLPAWMRDDQTAQALVYALTKQLQAVIAQLQNLEIYTNINAQPDAILDELAWQFNAIEYDPALPRSTKVQLVESAILNNRQRGTVAAVERIATQIFGDAWVEEWFNYPDTPGSPYHFRVHTSNVSVGDQEAAQFSAVVASAQNVRSVLDSVIVETVERMNLYFGGVIHTADVIYM